MNRTTYLITLVTAGAVLSGCAMLGAGGEPDARWADYRDWSKLNATPITGDHTGFLGGLHEGAEGAREVYVNDVGWAVASGSAPYRYPVGTVIAKEQYDTVDDLQAGKTPGLTIMIKVSNDAANPANNWQWSRGYRKAAGEDTFCSGCHTVAMSSDFVFSNAESLKDFR